MQQTINLIIPKGWQELTDKQLLFVYRLLADGLPSVDIRTKCLLKWSNTHVVGEGNGTSHYLLKHRGQVFDVSFTQVAAGHSQQVNKSTLCDV